MASSRQTTAPTSRRTGRGAFFFFPLPLAGAREGEVRLPEEAAELLGVRTIKENHGYYTVLCRICYPNRQIVDRNYFVVRGCENEEMLLQQLERRRDAVLPERTISRMPMRILLSTIVCIGIILICVFSHPAVGMLPQVIYFPCLAGVVIAAFFIIYYVIRYRRGE